LKIKNLFLYSKPSSKSSSNITKASLYTENNPKNEYIKNNIKDKASYTYQTGKVSQNILENMGFIRDAFETNKNFDLVIREFKVKLENTCLDAFLIFYDGLSNKEYINRDILKPLMNGLDISPKSEDIEDIIYKRILSQAPNTKQQVMESVIEAVCFGNCAVFVDGCSCAFVADIKGWSSRSVGRPVAEAGDSGICP